MGEGWLLYLLGGLSMCTWALGALGGCARWRSRPLYSALF